MNFPEKLKRLRFDKGYTQDELAEKLKISKANISHYETGKNLPDSNRLKLLSEIFDVSIDYLINDDQDLGNKVEEPKAYYGEKTEAYMAKIDRLIEIINEDRKDNKKNNKWLQSKLDEALYTINNHIRTGQTQFKGKTSHG